jgi:hypothetical protein
MIQEVNNHYRASQAAVMEESTDRWGDISGRWIASTQLREDLFASPRELEAATMIARKLEAHDYLVRAVELLMVGVRLDMRDGMRANALELGKFALEKANGSPVRLKPGSPLLV